MRATLYSIEKADKVVSGILLIFCDLFYGNAECLTIQKYKL